MIAVLVCAALLLAVLWRWCVKIHATMQIALRETFEESRELSRTCRAIRQIEFRSPRTM